jgi:hypothetical protein
MRLVPAIILLGTALLGHAHADGDSPQHLGDALDDFLGPREIAVGEALRAESTGSTSVGENPSGLAFNHELVLEGGYSYRLSDSASIVNASACDSTSALLGCFYYHYTGANPTDDSGDPRHSALNVFGSTLAYPITQSVSFGTNLKYWHFSTENDDETAGSGFAADGGLTFHINNVISIGGTAYNLIGPSTELPRAFGGGILVRPLPILSLSFDSRWLAYNGDHSARYGGGAQLFFNTGTGQMGVPIAAGVLHDNDLGITYLSGGIGVSTMSFGLDVAARFAVDGPNDTEILASIRLWPVRGQQ